MTDDFGLRWAIKRSFIDYIRRMPDGTASIEAGALPVGDDDEVLFAPEATGQRLGPDGTTHRMWSFFGDVRFGGHFGMLSVRVAKPRIILAGGVGYLDIADPTRANPEQRLHLLTLKLQELSAGPDTERWAGTDSQLTEAGSELFNEVYQPGEPFEDLTLTVPLIRQDNEPT